MRPATPPASHLQQHPGEAPAIRLVAALYRYRPGVCRTPEAYVERPLTRAET
jgi:hypothetical protein